MAEQIHKVTTTRCPRCQARLSYEHLPEPDSRQCCPECGAWLRVAATRPLELRWDDQAYCDDDDRWP
jgi:hypothetical protein